MSMPVVALACCALYTFVGVGLRMALQVRRTGSTGYHGYGGAGRVERIAGLGCILSSGLVGLWAPLAAMAGVVEPIAALEEPLIQGAGLATCLVSIAAMFYAQVAMGDNWRVGVDPAERTELVIGGPYALMRNPIYTAWMGTFAGLVLLVPSWLSLTGAALLLLSMEVLVRGAEEPYLREAHGAAFVGYAARVGRFVPGIGRLDPPQGASGDA